MSTPKVWLITGTSSGFGKELVLEALGRGDKVIATARNIAKIEDLKAAGADLLTLDVTSSLEELRRIAEEANKIHGRIDYLINNAGYSYVGGIEESTPEDVQKQFDTNVFGLLNVTRAVVPYMRARRSGAIGNLSSVGGWRGYGGVGIYCASKWAVSGFSETLSHELGEFNIKVCSIEPGYFRSNFLNANSTRDEQGSIADYNGKDNAVRSGEATMKAMSGQQRGDPKKAARIIVDVLSEATGKPVPIRLALGVDSNAMIKAKCEETIQLLNEWNDITTATDLDDQS